VPASKPVHVILDNYGAHKHPKVRAWLDRHQRVDGVEKADELLMAVALHVPADDGAVQDVEGGEQRGRAVALVIVGHGAEPSLLQGQAGLGPVERLARRMLAVLADQLRDVAARVAAVEGELMAWHRANDWSRRLATIPGVGPITASAIVATVGDATQFNSGRQFAAWLGLVPQQRSSGGKERLGRISKRGDGYIRRLMIHGARAVVEQASHFS
jgi:hypothetical protein